MSIAWAETHLKRALYKLRSESIRLRLGSSRKQCADITEHWNRAHSHLFPIPKSLLLPKQLYQRCPFCDNNNALPVLAHVQDSQGNWLRKRLVVSCPVCRRFALPMSELFSHSNIGSLAIEPMRRAGVREKLPVRNVNARLWTSQGRGLNLEPTTRCNFKCWYCIGRHMNQEDLTIQNFERILNHVAGSVRFLSLVGEGEPLLNRQFFEMVRMAKSRGMFVYALTNGSLLTQGNVKEACESRLDYLSVSVDSIRSDQFSLNRIGGNLEQIRDGIIKLAQYKEKHNYARPIISVQGTLFAQTKHELPEIVEMAKKWGANAMEGFQALNTKQSYVDFYPKEFLYHLKDVPAVTRAIRRGKRRAFLPNLESIIVRDLSSDMPHVEINSFVSQSCDIPWAYSRNSGQVTPCCMIKDWPFEEWNLINYSIETIFSYHAYENVRFNLWNGIFLPECAGCGRTGGAFVSS